MTDYTELKKLAQRIVDVQTSQDEPISKLFDEFEAAASPEAVLALIAENERLGKTIGAIDKELRGRVNDPDPLPSIMPGAFQVETTYGLVAGIRRERDQLRAENAGLRTGYEAYERVNAELKAENEVLLKALRVATVQMWNSEANMDVEAQAIEAVLAMSKGEQS